MPKFAFIYSPIEECNVYFISVGHLDLGNNFTYQDFIDAIPGEVKETIYYSVPYTLEDRITIFGKGNYGRVILNTCGNDLSDHLRKEEKNIFGYGLYKITMKNGDTYTTNASHPDAAFESLNYGRVINAPRSAAESIELVELLNGGK